MSSSDTVAVFAIDSSVEVVRNATSRVVDFIDERNSRVTFQARGIEHHFQWYHPYFGAQHNQTWYLEERWEEDMKYCGECVPEKSLFFAHEGCWLITERHGIETTQLYAFAVQTKPLILWRGEYPHSRTWSFLDHVGSLNGNTPLGKLLVQTSRRLPPELRENTMAILQQSVVDKRRNTSLTDAEYKPIQSSGDVLFAQLATVEYLTLPMLKRTPSEQPSLDLQPLRSPVSLQGRSTTGCSGKVIMGSCQQHLWTGLHFGNRR